jgi:hypothetical protein
MNSFVFGLFHLVMFDSSMSLYVATVYSLLYGILFYEYTTLTASIVFRSFWVLSNLELLTT